MAEITTTTALNGGSITVHVYEDLDGDGTGPNSVTDKDGNVINYDNHDSAALTGGTETTSLPSMEETGGNDYYVLFEVTTGSIEADSPTVDSHELTIAGSVFATASGLGSLNGDAAPTVTTASTLATASGTGTGTGSATLTERQRQFVIGTLDSEDENDVFVGSNI